MSYSLEQLGENLGNVFNNPVVVIVMIIFLGISSYTDIKHLKIYNVCNLSFLVSRLILIFIPIYSFRLTLSQVMGAILGVTILLIPAIHFMQKMGGDFKLVFLLGLFLGVDLTFILLGLSFILEMLYALVVKIITKKPVMRMFVPFAPFFTVSFIIMLIVNLMIF